MVCLQSSCFENNSSKSLVTDNETVLTINDEKITSEQFKKVLVEQKKIFRVGRSHELKTEEMINDGAKIIDVGGCSTRPGSDTIHLEEEWKRIGDITKEIRKNFPKVIISIDTFRSEIVKRSYDIGADIVNDVSGGEFDDKMFSVVSKLNLPYVLMHSRGNSQTMKNLTNYNDLLSDITFYFVSKVEKIMNEMN